MQHSTDANSIRDYLRKQYFEPARRRKETLVTLRAGDIHREMGLRNRVPNVCQVMESRLLEREAGVKVSSKQGPPSGRGTTLTVTYLIDLHGPSAAPKHREGSPVEHPGIGLFLKLRGLGAKVFAAHGGGEAWLKRERASFYGAQKRETK